MCFLFRIFPIMTFRSWPKSLKFRFCFSFLLLGLYTPGPFYSRSLFECQDIFPELFLSQVLSHRLYVTYHHHFIFWNKVVNIFLNFPTANKRINQSCAEFMRIINENKLRCKNQRRQTLPQHRRTSVLNSHKKIPRDLYTANCLPEGTQIPPEHFNKMKLLNSLQYPTVYPRLPQMKEL